jgi:hypothetical protein
VDVEVNIVYVAVLQPSFPHKPRPNTNAQVRLPENVLVKWLYSAHVRARFALLQGVPKMQIYLMQKYLTGREQKS